MTRDEVVALAQKAAFYTPVMEGELMRFAALVAAHEREECAKVCEDEGERIDASWMSCAAAIRSRT